MIEEIKTKDFVVRFEVNDEIKQELLERVVKFFVDNESFDGEVIMQSDGCIINAPDVLSEIADEILKFKVEWLDA